VLVIGFVILSNLKLLTNYRFWLTGIVALALCVPHFYWQYAHNFPSFKYHLIARSAQFKWIFPLKYIPNQLIAFNPITFGAVMYMLFKYKPANSFERSQYFIICGFILFFWIMTLRGDTQPQWTVAASIPIIVLLMNRVAIDIALMKYLL
jgi:hypothetical protein